MSQVKRMLELQFEPSEADFARLEVYQNDPAYIAAEAAILAAIEADGAAYDEPDDWRKYDHADHFAAADYYEETLK